MQLASQINAMDRMKGFLQFPNDGFKPADEVVNRLGNEPGDFRNDRPLQLLPISRGRGADFELDPVQPKPQLAEKALHISHHVFKFRAYPLKTLPLVQEISEALPQSTSQAQR